MEENIGIDIISVKLYIPNSFNYVIIMYKYKYLANIHITKWNIILYCVLPLLTILVISYFLSRSKGLTFNQKIVRLMIGGICDAFQTSAIEQSNNTKLEYLAKNFELSSDLFNT